MDLSKIVQPGLTHKASFVVEEKDLATHVGSGAFGVLATPAMIALIEKVSHALLAQHLPQGYSSVGTLVKVRHLAPTPQGATVHVRANVLDLDGFSKGGSMRKIPLTMVKKQTHPYLPCRLGMRLTGLQKRSGRAGRGRDQ
jgi:predicted thioesterase